MSGLTVPAAAVPRGWKFDVLPDHAARTVKARATFNGLEFRSISDLDAYFASRGMVPNAADIRRTFEAYISKAQLMAEKFTQGTSNSSARSAPAPGARTTPSTTHAATLKNPKQQVDKNTSSSKKVQSSSSELAKDKAKPASRPSNEATSTKKRPLPGGSTAQSNNPPSKKAKESSAQSKEAPAKPASGVSKKRPMSSSDAKPAAKSSAGVGKTLSLPGAGQQVSDVDVAEHAKKGGLDAAGVDQLQKQDASSAGSEGGGAGPGGLGRGGVRRSGHLPSQADFDRFRKIVVPLCDPFRTSREKLLGNMERNFGDWLALFDLNFSLYVFGTGSKRRLFQSFFRKCLAGEDVIEVDCDAYFSAPGQQHSWASLLMNLLRTIADNVIAHSHPSEGGAGLASSASGAGGGTQGLRHGGSSDLSTRGRGESAGVGNNNSHSALTCGQNQAYIAIISALNDEHTSLMQKTLAVADALMVHYGHSAKQRSSASAAASASSFPASGDANLAEHDGVADSNETSVALSIYNRPSRVYIMMLEAEANLGSSGKASDSDGLGGAGGAAAPSSAQAARDRVRAGKAEAMACLAVLSACRAVGLLLSSSSAAGAFTSGLDSQLHAQFRFAYVHAPTYELPAAHEVNLQDYGALSAQTGAMEVVGLDPSLGLDASQEISLSHKLIIKSLTPKHIDILNLLVGNAIGSKANKDASAVPASRAAAASMPWTSLFRACTERLVVKGDPELRQLLGELLDHRIVGLGYDGPSQAKTVRLLLPPEALRAYLSGGSGSAISSSNSGP